MNGSRRVVPMKFLGLITVIAPIVLIILTIWAAFH